MDVIFLGGGEGEGVLPCEVMESKIGYPSGPVRGGEDVSREKSICDFPFLRSRAACMSIHVL